ncbi:MAG: phospho-N-acetylmuramoyl-pentapeptide-transferase [Pirellulales bacterium]|nr:phospho-N-acetylmuramoyl-pentapeptide-transferase [Pirellulales bacterium]
MLVWLIDWLARAWPDANWAGSLQSFTKITFRTALASLLSFALAVLLGARAIAWLKQRFREPLADRSRELLEFSRHKQWTPTMGGLFLVADIAMATLLLGNWRNPYLPILLVNLVGLAAIGAVDDLQKLRRGKGGLRARSKLLAQGALAAATATWLYFVQRNVPHGLDLQFPFIGATVPINAWFIPSTMLVIVGSSNAANLADGLDGLAGGCLITTTAALGVIVYVAGHFELSSYLGIAFLPQAGETVVAAGALIGATLGFLWFNCQPAQVFMGDTGSLSLGGTLGLLAVIARQEILLLVIGAVFVAEAISVILQVGSFRLTGKRIFRCAPLHHHFQLLGWPESKIVTRFWIVSALCAMIGLGILKISHPPWPPDSLEAASQQLANLNAAKTVK